MEVVTTFADLRRARRILPGPVGFVPTMGYLHAGHPFAGCRSRAECAAVVASIFVNPTQFGPQEDLAAYPRDLEHDLAQLSACGTDLVWTPSVEEMYPPGFQTWVNVEELTRPLEGAMRFGHFRGVATVVTKLFNAVQPDRAFGQKDAQQAAVILRMVRNLNFDLEVIVRPILREPDGLAMSSRNTYLNRDERQAALVLVTRAPGCLPGFRSGRTGGRTAAQYRSRNCKRRAGWPASSTYPVRMHPPCRKWRVWLRIRRCSRWRFSWVRPA